MGRWSRQLAPHFVRFAGVQDGDAVLDVGAGIGALASAAASAAPAGRIVGIDPVPAFVDFARSTRPGDNVTFETGDAQRMRFDDGRFDRTLAQLVVNFIPDPQRAVLEMKRVTRSGGTIAAAVWDYGEGMEMLRVFWDAAIAVQPASESQDERYLPFCRRGELAELWQRSGLEDVAGEALMIQTRFTSFDDYWTPFLAKVGPAGAFVAALTAAERDQLKNRLRRRLLGDGDDRPFTLDARAWAARGIVP